MNWKNDLKLSDIDPNCQIETVCRRCKLSRVETQQEFIARTGLGTHLFMDEVEFHSHCANRFCGGGVVVALIIPPEKYEGFVGGMA